MSRHLSPRWWARPPDELAPEPTIEDSPTGALLDAMDLGMLSHTRIAACVFPAAASEAGGVANHWRQNGRNLGQQQH